MNPRSTRRANAADLDEVAGATSAPAVPPAFIEPDVALTSPPRLQVVRNVDLESTDEEDAMTAPIDDTSAEDRVADEVETLVESEAGSETTQPAGPLFQSPAERLRQHRVELMRAIGRVTKRQKAAQSAVIYFPELLNDFEEGAGDLLNTKITEATPEEVRDRVTELANAIKAKATPLFAQREAARAERERADAERITKLTAYAAFLESYQIVVPDDLAPAAKLRGSDAHLRNVRMSVVELMQRFAVVFTADEAAKFASYNQLGGYKTVVDGAWDVFLELLESSDATRVSKAKAPIRKAVEAWEELAGITAE